MVTLKTQQNLDYQRNIEGSKRRFNVKNEDDLSKTIALSEKIALFKKDRDVFIRHKQRNEE